MIVLGIDQAKRSGWAVHRAGVIAHSGFVHDTPGMVGVVELVKGLARAEPGAAAGQTPMVNVLVVFEDHSGISLHHKAKFARGHAPTRNTATILGMGRMYGRWELALDLVGHPERLRVSVEPRDWRGRVLGLVPSASTERCKDTAVAYASQLTGHNVGDHNEAEAICIACWGALDGMAGLERERARARMAARDKRSKAKQGGLPWCR